MRAAAAEGKRVALLALGRGPAPQAAFGRGRAPGTRPRYGHDLYANLRALDANGADLIVVEAPPADSAWEAVRDRLARAAAGTDEDDET